MKVVIYNNDEGGVSVIHPLPGFSVDDAVLSVPTGKKYSIIEKEDLPSPIYKNARRVDESLLTDGVGE